MKKPRTRLAALWKKNWPLLVLLLLPCCCVSPCLLPVLPEFVEIYRIRWYLVHNADHEAILRDARQLLDEFPPETGETVRFLQSREEYPSAIRDLDSVYACHSVAVTRDQVRMEFGGGFYHHGLLAQREGLEAPGDTKIIDGLWYHVGE